MGVNKIVLPNEVLIDLTGDTVDPASLLVGRKAHNAAGEEITGTMPDNAASTVTLDTSTTSHTIPAGRHSGSGKVQIVPQTKAVTPGTSAKTVTPDSGKVLSAVSVDAIQTEAKSVTPTASAQTVMPTTGKFLSSVSISAVPTQAKSVEPTDSMQTVLPDAGKFLSSVLVRAIPHESKKVYTGNIIEPTPYKIDELDVGVQLQEDDVFLVYIPGNFVTDGFLIARISDSIHIKMSGSYNDYYGESTLDVSETTVTYNGTVVSFSDGLQFTRIAEPATWYLIQ